MHTGVVAAYAKFGTEILALKSETGACMRRDLDDMSRVRERIGLIFRPIFSDRRVDGKAAAALRLDLRDLVNEVIVPDFANRVFSIWMTVIDKVGEHAFYGVVSDAFAKCPRF
jgi:hypothetical protein